MNRITNAIERRKIQIAEKNLPIEKLEETRQKLNMELDEFVSFQNLKNMAMMHGKITLEEAQTIYSYLGETLEHFNNQTLEVKATLTSLFAQLLNLKISGRM